MTLFRDQEILSSGAVGLAFMRRTRLDVGFLDVKKLSDVMTVTQSEGNMVNALNDDNPTQLLLSAIKESGLETYVSGSFKEEEQFSLGALSSDGKVRLLLYYKKMILNFFID